MRQRVYGVDFSANKHKSGDKTWISSAVLSEQEVFIEGCYPARDLPQGSKERKECLKALREFIRKRKRTVFGLDFPFSLPDEVAEYKDWERLIVEFPEEYTEQQVFLESCRSKGEDAPGDRKEYKRDTERKTDAPFAAYNQRMYVQTYHGIVSVLSELVRKDNARVLPMQSCDEYLPWLVEICPSSTLGRLGLPREGYKGEGKSEKTVRKEIVEGLEIEVGMSRGVREEIVEQEGGDALDSVTAALAAAEAVRGGVRNESVGIEGKIYV
jgi:hypothetical protein